MQRVNMDNGDIWFIGTLLLVFRCPTSPDSTV